MLITNLIDPETKRRQALARVYALLVRLAEDENKAVNVQPLDGDPLTAEQIDPKKEESTHE